MIKEAKQVLPLPKEIKELGQEIDNGMEERQLVQRQSLYKILVIKNRHSAQSITSQRR